MFHISKFFLYTNVSFIQMFLISEFDCTSVTYLFGSLDRLPAVDVVVDEVADGHPPLVSAGRQQLQGLHQTLHFVRAPLASAGVTEEK